MKKQVTIFMIAILTLSTSGHLYGATENKNTLSTLKLNGDLRLRYQTEKKESSTNRTRNRIRFRLGGESSISEKSNIKFGLATGDDNPRSNNQTLTNSFETLSFRLNYAFIKHTLSNQTTLFAGKMKNPLWRPSDLIWDSDINPNGVAVTFNNNASNLNWFITGGYFVLDELKSDTNDPYLLAIQPGINWTINNNITAKTAIGFYVSQHLKGNTLEHSAETNTTDISGLDDEFSSIVISGQVDLNNQMGLPLIRPFGEIVINTNKTNSNKGAIAGIKFGDKKIQGLGDWESKISYRYLGTDAWFDTFPDSDAYGGATNIEGLELIFNYGLSKTSVLGFDLYSMQNIHGTKDKQTLLQLDLTVKF